MKSIFRAPVDHQHFKDTIEQGKPLDEVVQYLSGEDRAKLSRITKNGLVKYWGSIPGEANTRNFKKLKEDDELLCYRSGHYIALCFIGFKTENKELARHSWGETEAGKTWELIYFFKEVNLFKIDSSAINSKFGYKDGPVMGFSALSENKANEFLAKYNSVKRLVDSLGEEQKIEDKIHKEISKITINSPYEAQYYLVDLGNQLEFDTFVPASDAGRKAFDKKLIELITVRETDLQDYVAPVALDPISHIDVIWFKNHYQPKFFFEVVHKTGMSEAFLRLDLAIKHYEFSKARVVGKKDDETEYEKAMRLWSGPKDFLYRDYDQLTKVHSETLYHKSLIEDFLG